MATNYYVLSGNPKGTTLQVAFHVVVPAGDNAAGVAWQTAVVEYRGMPDQPGTTSIVPGLAAAEQTKLDAGQLVEFVEPVRDDANASDADRKSNVETHVRDRAIEIGTELGHLLQHWGESGSVT